MQAHTLPAGPRGDRPGPLLAAIPPFPPIAFQEWQGVSSGDLGLGKGGGAPDHRGKCQSPPFVEYGELTENSLHSLRSLLLPTALMPKMPSLLVASTGQKAGDDADTAQLRLVCWLWHVVWNAGLRAPRE
jgi:hypothetical protein